MALFQQRTSSQEPRQDTTYNIENAEIKEHADERERGYAFRRDEEWAGRAGIFERAHSLYLTHKIAHGSPHESMGFGHKWPTLKSKTLYGIYESKQFIVKDDVCYLVEGYMDVIQLHEHGIKNVLASSGTSLTKDQIILIKRLTSNIVILFDGDQAGLSASLRSIDMILEQNMNVNIVLFPESEDPDSFARNKESKEIINYLNKIY